MIYLEGVPSQPVPVHGQQSDIDGERASPLRWRQARGQHTPRQAPVAHRRAAPSRQLFRGAAGLLTLNKHITSSN